MINLLKLDNEMGLVMLQFQHETHDCKYLFKTYTYSRGFLLLQVASLNMYYIKSNTIMHAQLLRRVASLIKLITNVQIDIFLNHENI